MSGRHRMRRGLRRTAAVAAATALVVAAAAWIGYRRLSQPSCSGQLHLTVAATPEIAPALAAAGADWAAGGAAVGGVCVAVDVTSSEPADVAATVATRHGVSLAGVEPDSGPAALPDVWVPDSSTWLLRLRGVASEFTPTNAAPVASSPVVVAMPEPVAVSVGWPTARLSWADLVRTITGGAKLRTGIAEPTRDAPALSALLALGAATDAAADTQTAQKTRTGLLRVLAAGRAALRQDLLMRFPRSTEPAPEPTALGAAALSEADVIRYNATKPPIALAALYLDPAPRPLDYPYTVMPGVDPAKAAAAAGLFEVIHAGGFRDRLAALGLRAPDGSAGPGFAAPRGAPSLAGALPPVPGGGDAVDPATIARALSTWVAVTLPARMLAVIDVSGSMRARVPTAGNATRAQVTLAAAEGGLALFDDSWAVGLWIFSTELDGTRDYRELVKIGPLSDQRAKIRAALGSIVPSAGDTGLYDTMIAAYRAVQDGWEPGRVNSVVMLTDGKNDDANGISRAQLLADLKRIRDPKRPIQVVIIGIGADVDQAELRAITDVTGGGVFVTEDPAKIGDIFLLAISSRPNVVVN